MTISPQAMQRAKTDHRTLERLLERVERLEQQVANQATKLAAVNDKTQRAGVTLTDFAGGAATIDVSVIWPEEWPDTAYLVDPTLITGAGAMGFVTATLKPGSKQTAGCTITVKATQAVASIGLDVLGVRT